eukprot:2402294-Amphidinium_carterae.1
MSTKVDERNAVAMAVLERSRRHSWEFTAPAVVSREVLLQESLKDGLVVRSVYGCSTTKEAECLSRMRVGDYDCQIVCSIQTITCVTVRGCKTVLGGKTVKVERDCVCATSYRPLLTSWSMCSPLLGRGNFCVMPAKADLGDSSSFYWAT